MSTDIVILNDLWEEDEEGVITTWLVNDGDSVDTGDTVAEVMVQKAQYEILAPASGAVKIQLEADETVAKGSVIGQIV